MYYTTLVSILNSHTNREKDAHDIGGRRKLSQAGSITNIVCQGPSIHIIHYYVGGNVLCSRGLRNGEIVVLHNIRMAQGGDSLRFTLEAHSKIWVCLWIGAKELDGHIAARLHIKGLPDLSQSPLSQQFLQFISVKTTWICTHANLRLSVPL